jgi:hypothetical protein
MMRLPEPSLLYTNTPEGGGLIEGRANRKGASNMKIGAYTKFWQVSNMRRSQIQPEGMPEPVNLYAYNLYIKTFVPLLYFDEIKRYDTIGFWDCSLAEIKRHHVMAATFAGHEIFEKMKAIEASWREDLHDCTVEMIDTILNEGDTSYEQFEFYVKEHEASASPWDGLRWGEIYNSAGKMKLAHAACLSFIRKFRDYFDSHPVTDTPRLIRAKWLYPGVRARPADYTIIKQTDFEVWVLAQKWRDRKVGGVAGLSQMTFPIFKHPSKKKFLEKFNRRLTKLSGFTFRSLEIEGPKVFLDLANEKPNCIDLKTAEKQTGLICQNRGFAADLSLPGYEKDLSAEMYSGLGFTPQENEIAGVIHFVAQNEAGEHIGPELYKFSDNWAQKEPWPGSVFYDAEDTFCGFNPQKECFGPPSLMTDNPNHRLKFEPEQRQSQRMQYIMRPMLALILNDVGAPGSCKRFLERIVDEEVDFGEADSPRKDHLTETVLSRDRDYHATIIEDFPQVEKIISQWFVVQRQDASFSTDLRVY